MTLCNKGSVKIVRDVVDKRRLAQYERMASLVEIGLVVLETKSKCRVRHSHSSPRHFHPYMNVDDLIL